MIPPWYWIALGASALLLAGQEFRVYRIRHASKQREELFQIVTENAADMIALVDVKGHRLYNSPAYRRILGYSAAELGETSAFEQIHPDDRFQVLEAAQEARRTGVGKKLEYRIRHKNGNWLVLESIAGTIRDSKGDVAKLVIVNRDITEGKRAEEQAEHNSFHDGLTGLPNRRLFLDRLQHLFERAQRDPHLQYAVLFVDLDGFKVFNDTMGPEVGDQVLVQIGRRLETCLRDEDTISRAPDAQASSAVLSRMGGDEFSVLLESLTDPSDAMRVGNRILSGVSAPLLVEGHEVSTSASVGIAWSRSPQESSGQLLQDADVAMRRAKALGGSRCEMFDEAMHTRAVNRVKLETELRQALAQQQFRLYYQPIVHLASQRITGVEALLRWQHPERGLISPYKFIAAAEDTGLLVATGHWVIEETCRQLQAWKKEISSPGAPNADSVRASVNISATHLNDKGFVRDLEETLRTSGVDASQLCLELTENVVAADSKLAEKALLQLKSLRVPVILDDFGTGDSSLTRLRRLPGVRALKIDGSLITGILLDRTASETVELIILMAHKLKLEVIAEGIESVKQLERLQELGCEFGQGYLFSAPVDAKAFAGLLRNRTLDMRAKFAKVE